LPTPAGLLRVSGGESHVAVDFDWVTRLAEGVDVAGKVVGLAPSGFNRLSSLATRSVTPELPPYIEVAADRIQPDGSFSFRHISPGHYLLRGPVFQRAGPDGKAIQGSDVQTPATGDRGSWFRAEIAVDEDPIRDLVVRASQGVTVSGQINVSKDLAELDFSSMPLMVLSAERWNLDSLRFNSVRPDRRFTTPGLPPGTHAVVPAVSTSWFVENITLHGVDVTVSGIELSSGSDVEGLAISLARTKGEIAGQLTDPSGKLRPDAHVVYARTDGRSLVHGPFETQSIGRIRPDRFGDYVLQLPAGQYKIAAVAGEMPIDWRDSSYIESLMRDGASITVAQGERLRRSLKTVSAIGR